MKKNSKRQRTITDAIKTLPIGTRREFKKLWESVGCMDLYDGELVTYIQVIRQSLESKNRAIEEVQKVIMTTADKLNWMSENVKKIVKV